MTVRIDNGPTSSGTRFPIQNIKWCQTKSIMVKVSKLERMMLREMIPQNTKCDHVKEQKDNRQMCQSCSIRCGYRRRVSVRISQIQNDP